MSRAFPPGFRWGTATAAHQVEGGNVNNDWWAWEQTPGSGCVEPSGDTCDQYHRYPSDLALLAALGFDTYRFSIEWSRIEPEEGQFSTAALDHYRRVCAACLEHGLEPTVTFHHFTTPRWATVDGGLVRSRHRRSLRSLLREGDRPPRRSDRPGLHDQRAQHRELHGLHGRPCSRPGVATATAGWRPATTSSPRHRRAVEVLGAGPGDFPVGLTVSMSDYQAGPGRRSGGGVTARAVPGPLRGRVPAGVPR